MLFADIAGFTAMTERAGAARTVEIMNAYFDEVTRIIGAHNGIVTQFQGDAVLATFNVPVEDARHARQRLRGGQRDPGVRRGARVRRASASACASASTRACWWPATVGGGGRQSYTVYGGTVNLAARLEALCKEHGTSLLLSAATAKALPEAKLIAVL